MFNNSTSAFSPTRAPGVSAFYVKNIRVSSATATRLLFFKYDTYEIVYSTASAVNSSKTFIIDHPIDTNKYLVHACLEGPESGVYYRGNGEIINNKSIVIVLPDYVPKLAYEFTVQVSAIYNGVTLNTYNVGKVVDNQFTVYGENGQFSWIVHGKRSEIQVDPYKADVVVKGDGPYKWIHF